MSRRRTIPQRKRVKGICTYCQGPVKAPKRYWCSRQCVFEWKVRRSTTFARYQVWKRDRGICAGCHRDTKPTEQQLKIIQGKLQRCYTLDLEQQFLDLAAEAGLALNRKLTTRQGILAWRRSLWDCDHILPVDHGGGGCGLDGLQTLCLCCHHTKTAQQAKDKAAARAKLKKKTRPTRKTRTKTSR